MEKVRIAAIIAEFNPFHNGHKYIIDRARQLTNCTHILAIQSGNWTQRAEPAIVSKWARAEAAVLAGADAVVEIPTAYATGNAEVFAKAGVQIAASFPHVTHLVFGIEDKDLRVLKAIAMAQVQRKTEFDRYIKQHIKKGMGYDSARTEVTKKLLPKVPSDVIAKTLSTPNNRLAVEYLKELLRLKSQMVTLGVVRTSSNHTDKMLTGAISSATAIRTALDNKAFNPSNYVPEVTFAVTKKALDNRPDRSMFESVALFAARTKLDALTTYNCNEELVGLITNLAPATYEELKSKAPTRRFSVSRICRLALHAALGITKADVAYLYKNTALPYTNLLAISEDAHTLFAALCLNERTPVIVRGNANKPRKSKYTEALQQIDARAEILYNTVCKTNFFSKTVFIKATAPDQTQSRRRIEFDKA